MRGVLIAAALAVVSATAAAPASASKDAAPRTHVAVFDSVSDELAGALLQPGSFPAGRPVEIAPPVPGDTLSLFEQRVVQRLRAEGVNVRVAAPPPAPTVDPVTGETKTEAPAASAAGTVRLGLRVESKSVVYTARRGRFPLGTKGYDRLVSVAAHARLVDAASGEVLWARSDSKSAADFVKAKDVAAAASGTGLFAPGLPRGSAFGFLEPLLVTGVVASLVVLFYSNRT